jgi:hypothetical protein
MSNDNQKPVRTMQQEFQQGYGQFLWDGRNDEGEVVAGGIYTVDVFTGSGRVDSAGPNDAHRPLPVYDLSLDRATGRVGYRLSEPARVQVRLGIGDGGPLLRTMDAVQGPGHQLVQWDGWDQSRAVNFLHHEQVVASVRALSLPENSIIVHDETMAPRSDPVPFRIRFVDPDANAATDGLDRLIAEISIHGNPAAVLGTDRYEWVFFVDHRFVFEEERITNDPYRFQLDVGGLSQGEHILTVNLVGREDNSAVSFSERFERRPR